MKQASEPRTASGPRAISDCRTTVSVTLRIPQDRKHSVTVSRRHTTMSEHIATYPVLAQWSSLPLAFVSRSVGVVSGTPSLSPALRRTVGRATRGSPECRANTPLGMGVHHELAQDEQTRRADHTRHYRVDLQLYECDKSQSQAVPGSVAVRESPPVSIRAELPSNGSLKKSESHRQSQSTLSPHQMAHQRPAQRRGWLRTSRGIHTKIQL